MEDTKHAEGTGADSAYAEYTEDADHADRYELPPGMKAAIRRIAKEVSQEVVNTMLTVHTNL